MRALEWKKQYNILSGYTHCLCKRLSTHLTDLRIRKLPCKIQNNFKHITNLNELDGNSGLNGENPEQESVSLVLAFISIA